MKKAPSNLPKAISEKFVQDYLICALWSSNDPDDNDEPFDSKYGTEDFSSEALTQAINDCNSFIKKAGPLLDKAGDDGQNGHDFWLTRNGHGAGFWDRGYDEEVGDKLTDLCKAFREKYIVVGDDGKLHFD